MAIEQGAVTLVNAEGAITVHVCLDIRGALMNWSARDFATCFRHDDGRKMTAREAKNILMDELALGHEVIPCGPCDNFDYKTGCRGHRNAPQDSIASSDDGMAKASTLCDSDGKAEESSKFKGKKCDF